MRKIPMDEKKWVENWKRVGPILEKIEAEELRAKDQAESIRRILPMIDWCCQNATPKTTSGLVEQQRYFTMWRQQHQEQEE
jgi:hypothetical protein